MTKTLSLENFVCPECNQKPEICTALTVRKWSVRNLSLPYFVCVRCLTCGYDKRFIRNHISQWRNDDNSKFGARRYFFKEIYEEVIAFLEEVMIHRIKRLGYRRVNFKYVSKII